MKPKGKAPKTQVREGQLEDLKRADMKFKDFFPLRLSKLSQFFHKRVRKLKSLCSFHFIKKDEEDWKLYTLSRTQLKNLIDKNIHFHFFQLEDFSIVYEKEAALFVKESQKAGEKRIPCFRVKGSGSTAAHCSYL